ncbi:MAG: BamA/TamA family outer membrane protein, partial [Pseudohongiellaceae bacterium]
WKLAVFADAGNAFNDFADYELKTGAGVGVRWLSPIGPIRVDLASALDNDNKLRLHITMGPDL